MRRQLSLSFPRQLGQAARLLLALLLIAAVAAPLQAAPAGPDAPDVVTIYKVYVSGVRDTNFTVSWTTDAATDGYVDWGSTTALGTTTADAVTSTRTHHVTIPQEPDKLTASTTYYFRVRSDGATDDNMGDLYTVVTGALLSPSSAGRIVWGYVYQSGGTLSAPDTVVYLQLQDANGSGGAGASQWIATLADSAGVWSYSLNNIRTGTAGAYFSVTDNADKLHIIARVATGRGRADDDAPGQRRLPGTDCRPDPGVTGCSAGSNAERHARQRNDQPSAHLDAPASRRRL